MALFYFMNWGAMVMRGLYHIRYALLLSGVFLVLGTGGVRAEQLISIIDGKLMVTSPSGVDIRLTAYDWCPSVHHSVVWWHQSSSLSEHGSDIRLFWNHQIGTSVELFFFPMGTEILLEIQDLYTQTRYFTGPASRNPDNLEHVRITPVEGSENTFHIGVEHGPCGGEDTFTDTQFILTARPALASMPADPRKVYLGLNVSSNNYYSTQFLFVDPMKSAMPWVTQNSYNVPGGKNPWHTGVLDQIPCDDDGYPLELPYDVPGTEAPQIVATLIYRIDGQYPAGDYTLLYDGEGEIQVRFDGVIVSQEPGRIIFRVSTPSPSGVFIKIMRSVRGNHIRNIRIIPPGCEEICQQYTFNPLFLSRFTGVKAIRFMDLAMTNDNPVSSWSERTTTTFYTQGDPRGLALEYMIDLANQMNADAWFCVPHMADDEYVRNMAIMIRDNLRPGKKVYVEYSNEVWNNIFSQSSYAREMGCSMGLWEDCYDGVNDGGDQFYSGVAYYAMRSAQIFKIFEEVFGDDTRLVKVLSTMTAIPSVTNFLLQKFHDPQINPYNVRASALGITGYFGMQADDIVKNGELDTITVDEIISRSRLSLSQTIYYLIENKKVADLYGLPVVAYEGGQHLVSVAYKDVDTLTNLLINANRHEGMGDLYRLLFDAWYAYGGSDFMVFSSVKMPSKHGCWGLLERMDQPPEQAPKYRAVMDYILQNTVAPPVADAGCNQTVHTGKVVTLDGSASSDPGGNYPLTYAWSFESFDPGDVPVLSDPTAVNPTFIPTREGDYILKLVVTNSLGVRSAPAYTVVSTYNSAPIADAGLDRAVTRVGETVQLDGTQSYDPDGDALTYAWGIDIAPPGSNATISDPESPTPVFAPDVYGAYSLYLMVRDEFGSVGIDRINIMFENIRPVADAGDNQCLVVGQMASLDGSRSFDANGDMLSFAWSIVSAPSGSGAFVANPSSANASLRPDVPGTYVVSLVVSDGILESEPSNITITVVSIQTAVTNVIQTAISTINAWSPDVFKNRNMAKALTNKFNALVSKVEEGNFPDAKDMLENDILKKTDGCMTTGSVDKNDWIIVCEAQAELYPIVLDLIGLLDDR